MDRQKNETAAYDPDQGGLHIRKQGSFLVGGHYEETDTGTYMTGQMYVQYQIPAKVRYPHPLVLIHGGSQTAMNFLATPDDREGWATLFLREGYKVYLVDQVGRGRSGFYTAFYGDTRAPTAETTARFATPNASMLYPQAEWHSQWPGAGTPGDTIYDQFFASQVEEIADGAVMEGLNRAAMVALLERLGPSVLVTHSQSAPIGWGAVNDRPALVEAILAIEPNGPPFYDLDLVGAPQWFRYRQTGRPYGITRQPLRFEPPIDDPAELRPILENEGDGPILSPCWRQSEPPRRLPNFAGVRIAIVQAEASYHSAYDHCTSKFLTQAGVKHDRIMLAEHGLHGNGHMMMLEKNSMEIARLLSDWIMADRP